MASISTILQNISSTYTAIVMVTSSMIIFLGGGSSLVYQAYGVDLIVNNLCMMCSFSIFDNEYKKLCCMCIRIQNKCYTKNETLKNTEMAITQVNSNDHANV